MTDQPVYVIEPSAGRVRDIPERLRPREEMTRLGAGHVSDDVLLAVILRGGVRGLNVLDLARGLLKHYGSLSAIAAAPQGELSQFRGLGPVKAQTLIAALEIGKRLVEEGVPKRFAIRRPEDAVRLLQARAKALDHEVFWVLPLDAKNVLKDGPWDVTRGLLDASLVHPREVFRPAVRTAAAAVVLSHNHPSGDPAASAEDLRITRQLVSAGRIMDIRVLDHVILGAAGEDGGNGFLSMREAGLVEFG